MGKSVIVIGGGIVGLSTAYFLNKAGHEVTVLNKSDFSSGASFVNAGYLTPSHIIPMAAPGVMWQGLKWMMDSSSPLYIKPRIDWEFFKWAWYFHRSSRPEKVKKAIPVIKEINILSRELFQEIKASGDLGDFQLERKGLLMLYQTESAYEQERIVAKKAQSLGLEVSELDTSELQKLQPNIEIDAKGAIHYECDGHTTPTEFMPKMIEYLKKEGIKLRAGEEVEDLAIENNSVVEIRTSNMTYQADEVVLAAGSWSGILAKKLNFRLPLQGGKGYCIDVHGDSGITIPAILMEAKMAVTPMRGFTRFAGTMEFSGINHIIRRERVAAIAAGACRFYPGLRINNDEMAKAKTGLRPVSPDGLPYIGRVGSLSNLIVATGHAMMGWSLGPATGKLVQQLVDNEKPDMDLQAFRPNRRFAKA